MSCACQEAACTGCLPADEKTRLEAEVEGVDIVDELRRYTLVQFWVFIPMLLVSLALWQWRLQWHHTVSATRPLPGSRRDSGVP